MFLGPQVFTPNKTSIRSAVFALRSHVRDWQTPGIIDRNSLHVMHSMRPNNTPAIQWIAYTLYSAMQHHCRHVGLYEILTSGDQLQLDKSMNFIYCGSDTIASRHLDLETALFQWGYKFWYINYKYAVQKSSACSGKYDVRCEIARLVFRARPLWRGTSIHCALCTV